MAAAYGKDLHVQIGNGASPEVFSSIGGARSDSFTLNNGKIDITNKDSNDWQQMLTNAGTRQASISISGIFLDSASERSLRTAAINRTIKNFKLLEPNGATWVGPFYVSSIQLTGTHNDAVSYSATLESAGVITYTAPV